jgi:hypothetical protein
MNWISVLLLLVTAGALAGCDLLSAGKVDGFMWADVEEIGEPSAPANSDAKGLQFAGSAHYTEATYPDGRRSFAIAGKDDLDHIQRRSIYLNVSGSHRLPVGTYELSGYSGSQGVVGMAFLYGSIYYGASEGELKITSSSRSAVEGVFSAVLEDVTCFVSSFECDPEAAPASKLKIKGEFVAGKMALGPVEPRPGPTN